MCCSLPCRGSSNSWGFYRTSRAGGACKSCPRSCRYAQFFERGGFAAEYVGGSTELLVSLSPQFSSSLYQANKSLLVFLEVWQYRTSSSIPPAWTRSVWANSCAPHWAKINVEGNQRRKSDLQDPQELHVLSLSSQAVLQALWSQLQCLCDVLGDKEIQWSSVGLVLGSRWVHGANSIVQRWCLCEKCPMGPVVHFLQLLVVTRLASNGFWGLKALLSLLCVCGNGCSEEFVHPWDLYAALQMQVHHRDPLLGVGLFCCS